MREREGEGGGEGRGGEERGGRERKKPVCVVTQYLLTLSTTALELMLVMSSTTTKSVSVTLSLTVISLSGFTSCWCERRLSECSFCLRESARVTMEGRSTSSTSGERQKEKLHHVTL